MYVVNDIVVIVVWCPDTPSHVSVIKPVFIDLTSVSMDVVFLEQTSLLNFYFEYDKRPL